MNPLDNAGLYLTKIVFDFYILIVIFRFLLESVNADSYNPVSQFVIQVTRYPLRQLNRIMPRFGHINTATILWIIALEIIKLVCLMLIIRTTPHIGGLIVWALGGLLNQILTLYFYLVLFQVILSWIVPMYKTFIAYILYKLTEPLLLPARRIIPPIAGIDISPILAIFILQIMTILIASPLTRLGMRWAFG